MAKTRKYFEEGKGIFFPQGLYNTPITPGRNKLYDQMLHDGFAVQNMRQLGFPSMEIPSYIPDYAIAYNCIGWAFGIAEDINPLITRRSASSSEESGKRQVILDDDAVTKKDIHAFIKQIEVTYLDRIYASSQHREEHHVVCQYSYREQKVTIDDNPVNYIPHVNDVMFYFGIPKIDEGDEGEEGDEKDKGTKNGKDAKSDSDDEPTLQHAAKYFKINDEENKWTSKIGDNLLVSHDLSDLAGGIYGIPEVVLIADIRTCNLGE